MSYLWFYIFNKTEFDATGLVSRTYTLILDGIGQKDILVTKGNTTGITYEGVFLPLNLNDKNPFKFDGYGIYIDADQNVWLGIEEDT